MNRRDALKGLGLTLGYTITSSSMIGLLHSCKTEVKLWTPKFLSIDEGIVLRHLIDIMLPKTKTTPGALDVNVPEFIDLLVDTTYDNKKKSKFSKGITTVIEALNIPEDGVSALKHEDYNALLAKYLRLSKQERMAYEVEYEKEKESSSADAIIYTTLVSLRDTSVWAFRNSEQIGEQFLAYDPIPGAQIGCVSVEESTKGKAWSL